MTVKVRSSDGEAVSNDDSPDLNSPDTIVAGDRMVILFSMNDDNVTAASLTPASGWDLEDEITDSNVGDRGMRYALFTHVADSGDVATAGDPNVYTFSGFGATLDYMYGIFSLFDDSAGAVTYRSGSLDDNWEDGVGGTDTQSPTQVIGFDGSLVLNGWSARQGTDYFNIGSGVGYAPTGGDNPAVYHDTTGWASSTESDHEWVTGSSEFDISDSPVGVQTLTHTDVTGDPDPVDYYSVSMVFEVAAAAVNIGTHIKEGLFT